MPRYYCDYCDTYLTHDSPSVRKQHNAGYKHKANVRLYYQQFEEQQTQSLIDQRIKEHLGQAAAFQQVGAAYNQHLMAQRPRLPILPTPVMPMGQLPNAPMIRPPVLPRPPPGGPGYVQPNMPPMMLPPGAPGLPQMNGLPRPPSLSVLPSAPGSVPPAAPGSSGTPTSGSAPPLAPLPAYQPNPAGLPPPSGGFDNFNAPPKAPDTDN